MKNAEKKLSLTTQIFAALVFAVIAGLCMQNHSEFAVRYIRPVGTIFLNLIKFIVCPVVLFSIMSGVTSMRDVKKVASIGWKTLLYFFCTTVIAVSTGLLIGIAFSGLFPVIDTIGINAVSVTEVNPMQTLVDIFPSNFFAPLVNANMLQVIVMALLLGFSMVFMGEKGESLIKAVNKLNDMCLKCMELILKASPFGVFCMLTPVIAENGEKVLGSLLLTLVAAYIGFAIQLVVVYGLSVKLLANMSTMQFFRKMAGTMAFAFSSASSVGTLSMNLKACEDMGADSDVSSFVLPLGATINMGGTAIYMGICSIFVASSYGIHLTLFQMITVVVMAVLASVGTAGVPGSGMVMLSMVLASAGLPLEGVALVAGIDRIFDMGRTVVNITGDSACAVIVSHIERDKKSGKS